MIEKTQKKRKYLKEVEKIMRIILSRAKLMNLKIQGWTDTLVPMKAKNFDDFDQSG